MGLLLAIFVGCAHSLLAVPGDWKALAWPGEEARELGLTLWREHQATGVGWQKPAPVRSGSLLEQWWCSPGVPVDDCRAGTVAVGGTRGSAWRGLTAVLDELGQVDWINVDAGRMPGEGADGLALTLRLDARDLTLVDWEIVALRYAGQTATSRVVLGPELYAGVEQSSLSVPGPALEDLLASPESFARAAGGAYTALREEIERAAGAHELRRCAYGRYHGDGSPRCDLVRLTPLEERGVVDRARLEQGHYASLLRSEAPTLHALLVEAYPATLPAHPGAPPGG
jgi:hypothetical protein